MLDRVIREWLAEFKTLSEEEVHSYAATLHTNEELVDSLNRLFESRPPTELLDPVCHQLYEFYRSEELQLRRFALEFVPVLIWLYLSALSYNDKKNCGGAEAFLLGIYNLEIVHSDGTAKVQRFRIPCFGQPSVYHEPGNISTLALTESALSRYNRTEEYWQSGPHPQYESINGQNRHAILAYVMQCFNSDIINLSHRSHMQLCKNCSRVVMTGFRPQHHGREADGGSGSQGGEGLDRRNGLQTDVSVPRIAVSPALLVEMLCGVYMVMFNSHAAHATQTVADIHARACYELYSDVILMTNAIQNSLQTGLGGQPGDGPMGISLAVPPPSSSSVLAKSAITNASFRTKKLPEDISLEDDVDSKLATIEEDGGGGAPDTPIQTPGGPRSSGRVSKGSKGAAKKAKDAARVKDGRRESDVSTKSSSSSAAAVPPALNGDSSSGGDGVNVVVKSQSKSALVDGVNVVVKSQSKSALVDSVELSALAPASKRAPGGQPLVSAGLEDSNRSAGGSTALEDGGDKVVIREKNGGATTAEICSTNL